MAASRDYAIGAVSTFNINNLTGPLSSNSGVFALYDGPNLMTVNVDAARFGINPFASAGVEGIRTSAGDLVINVNTGHSGIHVVGPDSSGISGRIFGQGNLSIINVGNITSEFKNGIIAYAGDANGPTPFKSTITIHHQGNIAAGYNSIFAFIYNDGDISVTSVGKFVADASQAIDLFVGGSGNISVSHSGKIDAAGVAIQAQVGASGIGSGDITILNTGNLTSTTAGGIITSVAGDGDIRITNYRKIDSFNDGIYGRVDGDGNVFVNNTADITSIDQEGIDAEIGNDGNIFIHHSGWIQSYDEAIDATIFGNGNIFIVSSGRLTAPDDIGIDALIKGDGNITVVNTADITSDWEEGIDTEIGNDGNISIQHSGSIQSYDEAIDATINRDGDILIVSSGRFTSQYDVGIDTVIHRNGNITIINHADIFADEQAINAENGNRRRRGNGDIRIINFGNLTSYDDEGIFASVGRNGNVSVLNEGTINSVGDAIYLENGRNPLRNRPQADRGRGNLTVHNTGDLNSTDGSGIYIETKRGLSDIVVTNFGSISAGTDGISIETHRSHGSVVVNNYSPISSGDTGIYVARGRRGQTPATINNHALISGGSGFAIDLWRNGHDTVNLFGGSVLMGAIDFGDGNDGMGGTNPDDIDRLNIMPGLNAELRFADNSGSDSDLESAPEIIHLAGGGTLISGGTGLVAVDATGFSVQSTFISDLTDSLFNLVDLPNTGTGTGGSTHGGSTTADGSIYSLWASGFGGYRDQRSSHRLAASDHRFSGIAAGMELTSDEALGTVGLVGGYGRSRLNVAFEAGHTEINSYYGGAYWKGDFEPYQINLALLGGLTDNDTNRNVGTVTGLMNARSRYNGWFISPALTLVAPISALPLPVVVSGRVNYVGLHLDGYTEEGTTLPLTVAARSVSLVNTRAQVSFPQVKAHSNGSHTHVDMRLGVDATLDAGSDTVAASVTGIPFGFEVTADDTLAGYAALGIAHTSADGMKTLSFNAELQKGIHQGYQAEGHLKATFRF